MGEYIVWANLEVHTFLSCYHILGSILILVLFLKNTRGIQFYDFLMLFLWFSCHILCIY